MSKKENKVTIVPDENGNGAAVREAYQNSGAEQIVKDEFQQEDSLEINDEAEEEEESEVTPEIIEDEGEVIADLDEEDDEDSFSL
jgi:hypothetical protein